MLYRFHLSVFQKALLEFYSLVFSLSLIHILISITADSIYRLGVARKNLDEQGEVISDFNGKLTKSPWVQITKDYQAIFHAGVRELGLSPSSRAKLAMYQVEANADISEEDELFDNI